MDRAGADCLDAWNTNTFNDMDCFLIIGLVVLTIYNFRDLVDVMTLG